MESHSTTCGSVQQSLAGLPVLTRSEPWYEDGNIILCAESKMFRVYRGHLATSSPIFRDTFSIGSSEQDEEIDGCPVLHLADQAEHLQHVLKALHNRTYLSKLPARSFPFSAVAAFIELGQKYEITYLYDEALDLLKATYPSSLVEWRTKSRALDTYGGITWDVIRLARQHDLLYLLPAAYFTAVEATPAEVIAGKQRPDGSLAQLSKEDQIALLSGKEALLSRRFSCAMDWFKDEQERSSCVDPQCTLQKLGKLQWYENLQRDHGSLHALHYVLRKVTKEWLQENLCAQCYPTALQSCAAKHRMIWDSLPEIFGLESWEKLFAEVRN